VVVFDPTEEAIREVPGAAKGLRATDRNLAKFARLRRSRATGRRCCFSANIEFRKRRDVALRSGAYGVGLYARSSSSSTRKDLPSRTSTSRRTGRWRRSSCGHPVTIRTFDLGGGQVRVPARARRRDEPGGWAAGDPVLPEGKEIFKPSSVRSCAPRRTGKSG